jgi:hypothetical protein
VGGGRIGLAALQSGARERRLAHDASDDQEQERDDREPERPSKRPVAG